jgi:hypothetical protein
VIDDRDPIPGIHGNHPTTEWLTEHPCAMRSRLDEPPREWPTPKRRPNPPLPVVPRPAWQRAALDALALATAQVRTDAPDVDEVIRLLRVAALETRKSAPATVAPIASAAPAVELKRTA